VARLNERRAFAPAASGDPQMPLLRGRSRKTVGANVRRLVHEFDCRGRIGASRPASRRKAIAQAVAIALRKAGQARGRKLSRGGSG
jgi:hypothetical protein